MDNKEKLIIENVIMDIEGFLLEMEFQDKHLKYELKEIVEKLKKEI